MRKLNIILLILLSVSSNAQLLTNIAAQTRKTQRAATITPVASNKAYVIIIEGQSNAVGVCDLTDAGTVDNTMLLDLPTDWRTAQDNIYSWWEGSYTDPVAGHWENMQPVVNTKDKRYTNPADPNGFGWSVEQKLSHLLKAQLNADIYIIKNAVGGVTISYWDQPYGEMWVQGARFITEALAALQDAGKEIHILGSIWLEGESDAINNTYSDYDTKFGAAVTARRGLDALLTNMPVIALKLRTDGYVDATKAAGVNSKLDTWEATNAHNYTIDPMTLTTPFNPDAIHYKNSSKMNIGQAVYDLMLANGFF